jgi:hypothetical protein
MLFESKKSNLLCLIALFCPEFDQATLLSSAFGTAAANAT